MTVYVYGLTYADVVDEIPGYDGSQIGASTRPVSYSVLTQWIERGSATINTMLARAGVTPSADLDADVHSRCATVVKLYVFQNALSKNATGAKYDQARREYEQAYAELSNRPQVTLGASTPELSSNIDTSDTVHGVTDWSFIGFSNKW